MMRLPPFGVTIPQTIVELMKHLDPSNGGAKVLAGGTDLLVNMKNSVHSHRLLVWPGKIEELRRISVQTSGELSIGAMATLNDVAASSVVTSAYPSFSKAILSIATPAIRNRATIGGNLCLDTRCYFYNDSEFWRGSLGGCLKLNLTGDGGHDVCHAAPGNAICSAVSSSDSAPILLALGASVEIQGVGGKRVISLAEFFGDDGMRFLRLSPGEILTRVILPVPPLGMRAAHGKIRNRESIDFPLANVGISGVIEDGRVLADVKIFVGAIQSAPLRMASAEIALEGRVVSPPLFEQAAREAASYVKVISNTGGTAGYRKRMVEVLVRRVLNQLFLS